MSIELKKFDTRMQAEGPEVRHLDPHNAPYYLPIGDEVEIFEAAYKARLPVLLKGPTGCGKTRFVEHMAHLLPSLPAAPPNLTPVACHEDLTGSDLVGRYLIQADETVWIDGPLTQAVRSGAICYLGEIVDAREDNSDTLHPPALRHYRVQLPARRQGSRDHRARSGRRPRHGDAARGAGREGAKSQGLRPRGMRLDPG